MASAREEHPGIDVQVQNTGPCQAKVRFTVAADTYSTTRARSLKQMAKRTNVKGFRPGKTPLGMLEKHYGPNIDREMIEHYLNQAYDLAVKENELRPAATPRIDIDSIQPPAKGEELSHEFDLLLRPEVELGTYKGMEVTTNPTEATDEEVELALEDVRRQNSRPEPVGDEGLPEEGVALCKLECRPEGSDEIVFERDGIRLGPKVPPFGIEEKVFSQAMTGVKNGEQRSFDIVFPEDFPGEEHRGKKGSCLVTVNEAYRIIAPTDEEIFKLMEVEDEAGLQESVRTRIGEAKAQQEQGRLENALLDQLIEAHPLDLPEPLLEEQVAAKAAELRKNLEEQGLDSEEIDRRVQEEEQSVRQTTSRAMRAVYLMEEIAKAEEIQVKEEDLLGELGQIAERNQAQVDEVRKYYQEQGLIPQLALELLERKVRTFLREAAVIKG